MSYIDGRDPRTQQFRAAEFGNTWAVHRGQVFDADDLTPFLREWKDWLATHDAGVRADLPALIASLDYGQLGHLSNMAEAELGRRNMAARLANGEDGGGW